MSNGGLICTHTISVVFLVLFRNLKDKIDHSETELSRKSRRTADAISAEDRDHTLTEDGLFSPEFAVDDEKMRIEELQEHQQARVKVTKSASMNDLSGGSGGQ